MDSPGCISLDSYINNYNDLLFRYLNKLTGSEDDAEDILQESLIKIAECLPDLNDPSKLKTWSLRIATNTAMDFFRKNRKFVQIEFNETQHDAEVNDTDIIDRIMIEKMNRCIHKKMHCIAPHYNTAITLFFFENMSISEIADICDVSVSAVKVRLHRGKNLLKKMLLEGCNFYINDNNDIRCYSKFPDE
jgi:RNA polymerase sigma-70 factor (ECF subfamily)